MAQQKKRKSLPKISMVYVTTPEIELAKRIAEEAVRSGLASCANFWSQMNSIYSWEGSLRHDQECVLIFKTKTQNLKDLEALVRAHHSYQVPCFLHWPLAGGSEGYVNWLLA